MVAKLFMMLMPAGVLSYFFTKECNQFPKFKKWLYKINPFFLSSGLAVFVGSVLAGVTGPYAGFITEVVLFPVLLHDRKVMKGEASWDPRKWFKPGTYAAKNAEIVAPGEMRSKAEELLVLLRKKYGDNVKIKIEAV